LANESKRSSLRTILWFLIIIGFMIMEYPGVLFFNRVDPMIFGLPFIYGFNIIMWAIMCTLFLIGYLTNWGKGADFKEAD
jgi:hypothetical protein